MAYSFRHTNPKLAGVLIKEKVRCGKQSCRCAQRDKLHKWYYYLYWRDYQNNGILRKVYVPQSEVVKLKRIIKTTKTKDMEEKTSLSVYLKLFNHLI